VLSFFSLVFFSPPCVQKKGARLRPSKSICLGTRASVTEFYLHRLHVYILVVSKAAVLTYLGYVFGRRAFAWRIQPGAAWLARWGRAACASCGCGGRLLTGGPQGRESGRASILYTPRFDSNHLAYEQMPWCFGGCLGKPLSIA
jgi:hypothetical protein